MPFCSTCGKHYFRHFSEQPHQCPPLWTVTSEDEGIERTVRGVDPEEAATAAVSEWFWDDPGEPLPDFEVIVQREGVPPVRVHVVGEYAVDWSAREIKKEEE